MRAPSHTTERTETNRTGRAGQRDEAKTRPKRRRGDQIGELHRRHGNQGVQRLVGQRLFDGATVGRPDDAYEREADRIAARVTADVAGGDASTARDGGQPGGRTSPGVGGRLPGSVRSRFEPAFGYDFGGVRVHTRADDVVTALNARAVTVGRDIFFHRSQYAPHTSEGSRLLAHELTHVVQQGHQGPPVGETQLATATTPDRRIQGGFFGDLWEGVKSTATTVWEGTKAAGEAVWEGTKAVGEAVWEGTKAVGEAVWEGTKAVGEWGWNVLKSGTAVVWELITETPERLLRVLDHLLTGVTGTLSWLWDGLKRLFVDPSSLGGWFVDGLLSGAAWTGRLISKLLDLAGFGEVFDLLNQIIKVNTRTLTAVEHAEAEKVFKGSISYWQVRIDEFSLIAALGKWFSGSGGGMGVTTFHTINFTRTLNTAPGNGDMGWLIHELTHVAQYEHVGSQYIGEALHAQATLGPNAYTYQESDLATKPFSAFNREQQGVIAETYYSDAIYDPTHPKHSLYEPRIDELRDGDI